MAIAGPPQPTLDTATGMVCNTYLVCIGPLSDIKDVPCVGNGLVNILPVDGAT